MAFKRTYSVPGCDRDLYVEVLVRCGTCGNKDVVVENCEVEYVTNSFIGSRDISDHGECPLCGKTSWEERAELVEIGLPAIASDSETTTKYLSLGEAVEGVEQFNNRLRAAEKEGFRLRSVLPEDETVVLWKD